MPAGMKIPAGMPARLACAATALARLPVEAQLVAESPNARARASATATTRSFKPSEGRHTASFFTHSRRHPSFAPTRAGLFGNGQPLLIPPQIPPALLHLLPAHGAAQSLQRKLHLERAQAVLADGHRPVAVAAATLATAKLEKLFHPALQRRAVGSGPGACATTAHTTAVEYARFSAGVSCSPETGAGRGTASGSPPDRLPWRHRARSLGHSA